MVSKRTLALEAVNMLSEYLDNRIGGKTQKEKDAINAITDYILLGDQPRPRGKWIFKHNSADIWCSNCDENFDEIPQKFLFCPNCGADMRPKEDEANENHN